MIRICNLCLEKLAKVDDDDDDTRSVISSVTSPFAAHQLGSESRSFNLSYLSQSPFAASQLFGRHDSFSLFSIAETRRPRAVSDDGDFPSRAGTPDFYENGASHFNHAPFRRAFTEEDKDPISLSGNFMHDHSPVAQGPRTPIEFPVTVPVSVDGSTSSVAFPLSSPDQPYGFETPGGIRSRYNSLADIHGPPFIRSRVQSRLDSFDMPEPGWRTRRESTA
jgi:1-phosphatidylinositol-3-phosphate 5-kinase